MGEASWIKGEQLWGKALVDQLKRFNDGKVGLLRCPLGGPMEGQKEGRNGSFRVNANPHYKIVNF
jgi:hypothetical protein